MGKLKELLMDKMAEANLTEEQENRVIDLLDKPTNLDLIDAITAAIAEVKANPSLNELRQIIHDNNNKYQAKLSSLELENLKLKQALHDIVQFEWNAWTHAKKLLEELK